jgi:transcriptional regulator with XRE-family HTH domain
MSTGTKIRQFRDIKKKSQEWMANALDMSQANYSLLEQDKRPVSIKLLLRIAELLQVSALDLLPPEAGIPSAPQQSGGAKDGTAPGRGSTDIELIKSYQALVDKQLQLIDLLLNRFTG